MKPRHVSGRNARASTGPPPFYRRVYGLVRRIPRGRVVTYGQVAAILGKPRAGRAVGTALGALRGPLLDVVPWQRVITAAGRCSHRDRFWADIQRELLESEGLRFDRHGRVDLKRVRWPGPGTPLVARGVPGPAKPFVSARARCRGASRSR